MCAAGCWTAGLGRRLDQRLLLSAVFFLHSQHHTGTRLADPCPCVCVCVIQVAAHARGSYLPLCLGCRPASADSNQALLLSAIFAPHPICPRSSLTFQMKPISSRNGCSGGRRRFPTEMTEDRSLFPLNLEDAGIVLLQKVVVMDQSSNLLGLFFCWKATESSAVCLYNPSSCGD